MILLPSNPPTSTPTTWTLPDLLGHPPPNDHYLAALHELQQLQSEPLCHRVAARLLVTNCQLLDGKNAATVLTDTGRQARDFVDSYAASLAICDLEKGSFAIPVACEPFREPALRRLLPVVAGADNAKPYFHVSPAQIKACLTGLGTSSSAWATWVSYRHKAVRFCEAARADHEKTQNVLVFQRLTKIMAKLADDVEREVAQRRAALSDLFLNISHEFIDLMETTTAMGKEAYNASEQFLQATKKDVLRTRKASVEALQAAETMHRYVTSLSETVVAVHTRIDESELSVKQIALHTEKAAEDMNVVASAIALLQTSSVSVITDLDVALQKTDALARRQAAVEENMRALEETADRFQEALETHANSLGDIYNITQDLCISMQAVVDRYLEMQNSIFPQHGMLSWFPFVIFPMLTVSIGSQNMPPSFARNFLLALFGEFLAVLIVTQPRIPGMMYLWNSVWSEAVTEVVS